MTSCSGSFSGPTFLCAVLQPFLTNGRQSFSKKRSRHRVEYSARNRRFNGEREGKNVGQVPRTNPPSQSQSFDGKIAASKGNSPGERRSSTAEDVGVQTEFPAGDEAHKVNVESDEALAQKDREVKELLATKDVEVDSLRQQNTKLMKIVKVLKLRNDKAMEQVRKVTKEKDGAKERCISMEGLIKIGKDGAVVKELELRVADLTCQLSLVNEEKVVLIFSMMFLCS